MALDRIDGLGLYDRTSGSNNKKVQSREGSEDTASFTLLKDEAQGVIYEPGRPEEERPKTLAQVNEEIAREEAAAARANLHSRFDGPGVAVELSTDAYNRQTQEKPASILDIIKDAFRAIGAFFSGIWNGGAEAEAKKRKAALEADSSSGDATQFAEAVAANGPDGDNYGDAFNAAGSTPGADVSAASAFERDNSPASALERDNSPEAAVAFLADYGGGHLAKNSDLLTQYDRSGHIISMDPSDKRRILQGEGRVRKY